MEISEPAVIILCVGGYFLGILLTTLVTRGVDALRERRRLRARDEAEARSERLLKAVLSEGEQRQLETSDFIEVPSSLTPGRVYRIYSGGRVLVFDGNNMMDLLCLKPTTPIPWRDCLVLHKVMIEGDEERYLRIANHSGIFHVAVW
jgi:hypothetical protein